MTLNFEIWGGARWVIRKIYIYVVVADTEQCWGGRSRNTNEISHCIKNNLNLTILL